MYAVHKHPEKESIHLKFRFDKHFKRHQNDTRMKTVAVILQT